MSSDSDFVLVDGRFGLGLLNPLIPIHGLASFDLGFFFFKGTTWRFRENPKTLAEESERQRERVSDPYHSQQRLWRVRVLLYSKPELGPVLVCKALDLLARVFHERWRFGLTTCLPRNSFFSFLVILLSFLSHAF